MKLYPFQTLGVSWLMTRKAALLADDMGLGKTVQAVCAAKDLNLKRVLVICPASVKYVWERTFRTWWPGSPKIQVLQGGKAQLDLTAGVVIMNYDILLSKDIFKQITQNKWDVQIYDEAHYLKNPASKRTKIALLRGGVGSFADRIWFLTGTPVLNRPIELFPMLRAAAPEVMHPFSTYIGFAKYFCGGYYDNFGFNDRGASHVDELNQRLVNSGFMLRRLKSAVLTDLPEKTFEIIPVEVAKKKEFEFMWCKDQVTEVNFGALFNSDDPQILGKIAEMRQYLALEKLPFVISHILDTLSSKEKVVVFAHHRAVIDSIALQLKDYGAVKLYGGMSAEAKNAAEKLFQNDKRCRVFVGQIQAAGVGLTLTAADTAVFAELDWTPGMMFQAADRIHRIGQKNNCTIQMFVTKDTLEEYMLRRLVEKKDTCERVLSSPDDIFS